MPELLVELFSEEIPARMQQRGAEEFQRLTLEAMRTAGLTWSETAVHVTPRRIALMVDDLPTRTPDVQEERKGPKVDAPDKAIQGFLSATGLTLDQCEQRDTPKGAVWFAVIDKPGRPAPAVLAEAIGGAVTALTWPKSMRWAEGSFRWVRPLHHILAVFDGAPLAGSVEPDHRHRFVFSDITIGHRFLAPRTLTVTGFADYRAQLSDAKVVLDRGERRRRIAEGAAALAAAEGLQLKDDPGLLDEVAGLAEWPVPLMGRIDEAFMALPGEVLTTSMRTHQRYFALTAPDGTLAPRFITVADTEPADGGAVVIAGNEKVLRARLSDARFFWDSDRATPLADRTAALAQVTFHDKLGTMLDKVRRIEALARALCAHIPGADADMAGRTARLAKADLTTGMVGEFPELQGLMGRYYALNDGEEAEVAEAVALHYKPLGPGDACPRLDDNPSAVAVALADKLDTLAGFFAIGETPTGSRDPFALRRAALSVIRLCVENGLRLPLRQTFGAALDGFPGEIAPDRPGTIEDLRGFFVDRLKVTLRDRGVRHDLVDAVFALAAEDDMVRALARVAALEGLLGTEDGTNLLTAYRRAANIARIEKKRDEIDQFGAVAPAHLVAEEEGVLYADLNKCRAALEDDLVHERFEAAMEDLAALRPPVDAFFDRVTVNADDPTLRRNRLALLDTITETMNRVADFSKVEG